MSRERHDGRHAASRTLPCSKPLESPVRVASARKGVLFIASAGPRLYFPPLFAMDIIDNPPLWQTGSRTWRVSIHEMDGQHVVLLTGLHVAESDAPALARSRTMPAMAFFIFADHCEQWRSRWSEIESSLDATSLPRFPKVVGVASLKTPVYRFDCYGYLNADDQMVLGLALYDVDPEPPVIPAVDRDGNLLGHPISTEVLDHRDAPVLYVEGDEIAYFLDQIHAVRQQLLALAADESGSEE